MFATHLGNHYIEEWVIGFFEKMGPNLKYRPNQPVSNSFDSL